MGPKLTTDIYLNLLERTSIEQEESVPSEFAVELEIYSKAVLVFSNSHIMLNPENRNNQHTAYSIIAVSQTKQIDNG